jgi:hypothetical protein
MCKKMEDDTRIGKQEDGILLDQARDGIHTSRNTAFTYLSIGKNEIFPQWLTERHLTHYGRVPTSTVLGEGRHCAPHITTDAGMSIEREHQR